MDPNLDINNPYTIIQDIYKDGKVEPSILKDKYPNLLDNVKAAINNITGIKQNIDPNFLKICNKFILDNSATIINTNIKPIHDISTAIIKVLPKKELLNIFYDSGPKPDRYTETKKDNIRIVTTPGTFIDPAPDLQGYGDPIIYPNISTTISLEKYALKNVSFTSKIIDANTCDISISITYNNNIRTISCKLDKKQKIIDNSFETNGFNDSIQIDYLKEIFAGNNTKNTIINGDFLDKQPPTLETTIFLLLTKELGDLMQVVFYKKYLVDKSGNRSNTFLVTTDNVIAVRCIKLNVPFFIHNISLNIVNAAMDNATFLKTKKIDLINDIINNNKKAIDSYKKFLKELMILINIKPGGTKRISDIIKGKKEILSNLKTFCTLIIEKFNKDINSKLNDLRKFINAEHIKTDLPIKKRINEEIKIEELKSMSFDDFRELAMQLRMNSIYVEDKLNIFLTSIFSNSQIINKYINNYNDINEETEIQTFFQNIKEFESIKVYLNKNKKKSGGNNSSNNDLSTYTNLIYSILHPYIECFPYLNSIFLGELNEEQLTLKNIIENILKYEKIYIDISQLDLFKNDLYVNILDNSIDSVDFDDRLYNKIHKELKKEQMQKKLKEMQNELKKALMKETQLPVSAPTILQTPVLISVSAPVSAPTILKTQATPQSPPRAPAQSRKRYISPSYKKSKKSKKSKTQAQSRKRDRSQSGGKTIKKQKKYKKHKKTIKKQK